MSRPTGETIASAEMAPPSPCSASTTRPSSAKARSSAASLREDETAYAYAFAVLRRYTRDFCRHEPGTRLGEDPEELHDMRVAFRRLRAAMSTFEPVLPPRFQTFRHDLHAPGHSLGRVRDLDVQIEWLAGVKQASDWDGATALGPLFAVLSDRRAAARQE